MDEISAREAASYLLKLQAATKSFLDFVHLMEPDFLLQPFQKELIANLDLLEKRKLRNSKGQLVYRLLVTMPPRVGKSTFITELFSVYCMCKEPELEIMSAAYNDELARTFGNKVRARVTDTVIRQAFPNLKLSNTSSSATHWRTQTGGAYYGVGLDGTTTGRAANCFTKGTLVVTPFGLKPIENIKIGDLVLSLDKETNSVRVKPVLATMSKANQKTVLFDGWVNCTEDQEFYDGVKYVKAREASKVYAIKDVSSLWKHVFVSSVEDQKVEVLLDDMQGRGIENVFEEVERHQLSGVWQGVLSDKQLHEVLRNGLQEQPSLKADERKDESKVSGWKVNQLFVGIQKATQWIRDRAMGCLLPSMWSHRQADPSHRREQEERLARELDSAMRELSQKISPLPVSSLERLVSARVQETGYQDVFDIEVEVDHNFFIFNEKTSEAICVCNCLIIDDPYRSRAEADSPTIREKVWNTYTTSLRTRKQNSKAGKKPIEVVVHTRWHPDDLAGRIQATPEWKRGEWIHLNYQAILERPVDVLVRADALPEDDPRYVPRELLKEIRLFRRRHWLNRLIEPREITPLSDAALPHKDKKYWVPKDFDEVSLWEERMPLEELRKMREIDRRGFDALYQQSPTIIGGNMIKPHWFGYYNEKPAKFLSVIMAADTAFKAKSKNDYSVMIVGGLADNGDIYVLDLIREKLEFPDLKRQMLLFASRYKPYGLRGIYVEDKASGQSIIQELRTTAPAPVIPFKLSGGSDKVARLASITPYLASGKVLLPKAAPWLDNFLMEAGQFPNGAHDDQMDTLYILVDTLSRIPIATQEILTAPIGSLYGNDSLGGPFSSELRSNAAGWMGNWKSDRVLGWGE